MEDWGDNKVKDKKKKRMNEVCEEKKRRGKNREYLLKEK